MSGLCGCFGCRELDRWLENPWAALYRDNREGGRAFMTKYGRAASVRCAAICQACDGDTKPGDLLCKACISDRVNRDLAGIDRTADYSDIPQTMIDEWTFALTQPLSATAIDNPIGQLEHAKLCTCRGCAWARDSLVIEAAEASDSVRHYRDQVVARWHPERLPAPATEPSEEGCTCAFQRKYYGFDKHFKCKSCRGEK